MEDVPDCVRTNSKPQNGLAAFLDLWPYYKSIYLIVDALDECHVRIAVLKEFEHLLKLFPSGAHGMSLHILLTGRHSVKQDIEHHLKLDAEVEIQSKAQDVENYLKQALLDQKRISEWIMASPDFEILIIDAILARVSGMFLLARLYVDLLAQIPKKRDVRRVLERLPTSIDKTYEEAWKHSQGQMQSQAAIGTSVLKWVIHAVRPLKINELQHALAIEEGDDELDPEGLLDADSLTAFCAGLIIIDESKLVSLVHLTTQEYFNKKSSDLFPNAHEEIASTCITYLRMKVFRDEGPLSDLVAFEKRWMSHPFLGYAAVQWGTHIRTSNSDRATKLALSFLNENKAMNSAMQALILNGVGISELYSEWPYFDPYIDSTRFHGNRLSNSERNIIGSSLDASPLHFTALLGLIPLASVLLDDGHDVNEQDRFGGAPLHWAILVQKHRMMEILLEKGRFA